MENDNAGNGLRGLRAVPSANLLAQLRERYDLDPAPTPVDLGGSSCLNLRVVVGRRPCVARVYRPYVSAARLEAIQHVRNVLRREGVPCPEPVPTRKGAPWTVIDGRLVEVERFVEFDAQMDTQERLEQGLPCLGRMHSILCGIQVGVEGRTPLFANHVEPGDAPPWTLRGTARIRRWGPTDAELRLADAAEELASRVTEAERDIVPNLPRQLVHGDFWDNNVGFRAGRLVLVTDFDFMGERARLDDLALTLYFASWPFSGEGASDERLARLRCLVDAYDSGLDEPLSPAEREALPLAMARQPLWGIGGWLARLDDEARARSVAASAMAEVGWALAIVREVERWQVALG